MASNKGMLILTCLKVSKISWSFVSLLFASNLSGKGATIFGLGNWSLCSSSFLFRKSLHFVISLFIVFPLIA